MFEEARAKRGNASGTATEHASSGNATEHVIATWQGLFWRNSKDCEHVIQVLLSLGTKAMHQHSQLQGILVQNLPSFFTPNQEDAFFPLLEQQTITDVNLRNSIIDFCASWKAEHSPSYRELLNDSAVAREANVLLPKDVPMWRWMRTRFFGNCGTDCHNVRVS